MANMSFGVNILPKSNNTYTLGNSDYKWNIFATQINGSNISDLVLPAVTSSNNGQILKVDNGAWTVGAAPTSLPAVTSSDNNKILQVSSGAWAVALLPNYYTKPSGGIPSTDLADTYLTSVPTMTGATSSANGTAGLIPAPTSADAEKFFRGDGTWQDGGRPMVILSYGNSVWNDFITAYNNNVIVYCRASSNSNPATGSQTRMAFMAYVNNATKPTEVEFQYYRSMSAHSATAMGDEVYVYKLTSAGAWSVTVRKASIKEIAVASGSKLGVSWSSDKVTLSNTMTANDMPMSSSDATTTKAAIDTLSSNLSSLSTTVSSLSEESMKSFSNYILGPSTTKTMSGFSLNCPYFLMIGTDNVGEWSYAGVLFFGNQGHEKSDIRTSNHFTVTIKNKTTVELANSNGTYGAYLQIAIVGHNAKNVTIA